MVMDLLSFFVVSPAQLFLVMGLAALGYYLEYGKVPFRVFGEEWSNRRPEVEPNFQPQRFPTESVLTARQFRLRRVE